MLWNSQQLGEYLPHALQRAGKRKVSCAVAHVNNIARQAELLNHLVQELGELLCLKSLFLFNSLN